MSQSVHLFPRSIPCYGPSDSTKCFPCPGVSGRPVIVSACFYSSANSIISPGKIASLKSATVEASLVCRSDSRRNSDFSKQNRHGFSRSRGRQSGEKHASGNFDDSELLSSKNGPMLSLSSSPKFQATAVPGPREKEIVELFRKVQTKLRERAAVKEEKKSEALQGQSNESETVGSLLKLLRKHSVQHGKGHNRDDASSSGRGEISRDLIFDEPKLNGSFHEEKNPSFSALDNIMEEDSQERNASPARPVSKFRRKSPVPRANYMPTFSDNDIASSVAHWNSSEDKGPGMVDTHLESGSELVPEPEPDPEPELDSEPQPEHSFSDELEYEVLGIPTNNTVDDEDGKEQCKSRDLGAMKLTELRSIAKSCGVKGFSKMKKADLVVLLSQCSL